MSSRCGTPRIMPIYVIMFLPAAANQWQDIVIKPLMYLHDERFSVYARDDVSGKIVGR